MKFKFPSITPSSVFHATLNRQIQVLVFYSDEALDMMGVSDVQMESLVSASIAEVNEGFANSEIGIDATIVHQTSVSSRLYQRR